MTPRTVNMQAVDDTILGSSDEINYASAIANDQNSPISPIGVTADKNGPNSIAVNA